MNQEKENAILLANIGSSDLEILIDKYFIPLGYRQEPNEDRSNLDTEQEDIWENRNNLIRGLCQKLKVQIVEKTRKTPYKFTELTEKIDLAFQENPQKWSKKIRYSRLSGIIKKIQTKFKLEKVIFLSPSKTKR